MERSVNGLIILLRAIMFQLAWKQLKLDKWRTFLTAIALGSVIAVILILEGFEQGQYYQLKQLVINRKADLVATQAGVTNFIAVRSSIPQFSREEVESVEGVINAHPITSLPIIYNKNNIRTPVYVLVYDTWGGPSSIIQGTNIQKGNDIVIDISLAKKYNLKIGDKFYVTDFEFKISGFTKEAAFMMPLAFISYDGMLDLFLESEIAPDLSTFPLLSYMLLEIDPAFDREKIHQMIEARVSSVDIFTPSQISERDENMGKTFYAPIIGLLVSVGYIIGMLVVGLIMYSDIRSRIKSFAILKALGFSFNKLFQAVVFQSLFLLLLAIPTGIILAQSFALFIHYAFPIYLFKIFSPDIFAQTLTASFIFAFIGAMIPLRCIHQTDPLLAFQGD